MNLLESGGFLRLPQILGDLKADPPEHGHKKRWKNNLI